MATSVPGPSSESFVDVLIVGAGPAGLMAANALSKLGVNVRIIDQRPDRVTVGQADGIQPRTIEIFQSYGIAERLLKEGAQMHLAAFYNPDKNGGIALTDRVADVAVPTAKYPFEVTLHQGFIEEILLGSILTSGVEVERPVIPVAIFLSTEDESLLRNRNTYPVKVTLKTLTSDPQPYDDNSRVDVVNAKFVIGADGAHSWVRKMLGITMEGEQTEFVWGVIDILPETNFPDIRNKAAIHSNHGSSIMIPREEDKVRVYIQLDSDSLEGRPESELNDRIDKAKMNITPEQILSRARRILHPYGIRPVNGFEWWTIYRIGQRVASRYSLKERIFIVGDACHTHSPKAGTRCQVAITALHIPDDHQGQGMNASMGDSHNLAWKLAAVLSGWADISLLKTYELERRKFAQDLISFDKQFAKLFSGKPRTEENQDGVSHEEFLRIFQTFGGFTSGVGIRYTQSTVVNTTFQNLAPSLVIGQSVPPQIFRRAADFRPVEIQGLLLADGRFKLLVFLGSGIVVGPVGQEVLARLAASLESVLRCLSSGKDIVTLFEILTIATSWDMKTCNINDFPLLFRSHWSKVLIRDHDQKQDKYSIDSAGVIAVVRPDGYTGTVVPLNDLKHLSQYFAGFVDQQPMKSFV